MTTKAELLRVIRRECKICMGGYENEITKCTSPDCPLFDFRSGKDPRPNPNKVKMGTERASKNGFKPFTEGSLDNEDGRE